MDTVRYKQTLFAKIFVCLILSFTGGISLAGAETINTILQNASELVGTPYKTGGIAPGGFDCSGFVSYLYRPTLPGIPRISRDIAQSGEPVEMGLWRPGDLLFYATGADSTQINHVAIWYSEGIIIHSISDGPETGVVMTPSDARYWRQRYISARRVLPDEKTLADVINPENPEPDNHETPAVIPIEKSSPWDDFDGVLRGDFSAWQQADEDAFEAYKKENG